jgi:hypothetical protein
MVAAVEELRPAIRMMGEAHGMPMVGVRVPVEPPAATDVAVVRPPEHAHAGEDRRQDPCIEDARVEPVPRATRVHPGPGKKPGKD